MPEHVEKPEGVANGPIDMLVIHLADLTQNAVYSAILREHGCTLVSLRKNKPTDPFCCIIFPQGVRIEREETYWTRTATRYYLFFPDNFYFTWYRNQRGEEIWNSLNIPLDDLPIKQK